MEVAVKDDQGRADQAAEDMEIQPVRDVAAGLQDEQALAEDVEVGKADDDGTTADVGTAV